MWKRQKYPNMGDWRRGAAILVAMLGRIRVASRDKRIPRIGRFKSPIVKDFQFIVGRLVLCSVESSRDVAPTLLYGYGPAYGSAAGASPQNWQDICGSLMYGTL